MEVIDSEENEQSATGSVLSDASAESSSSEEVDIEFEMSVVACCCMNVVAA